MSTFGVMVSTIADNINKTNLDTQIKRQVVAAMKKYRNRRFNFNKASSTFTTSDGQSVYPLPTGFMGDELVEVLDGNFKSTLTKRPYSWVAKNDNDSSYKSEPRVYAMISTSDGIRLFPTPDNGSDTTSGDYPLLLHYHKDLNAAGETGAISISASDNVTNAWMTDGFELIEAEATMMLYLKIIRGGESAQEATKWASLRNDHLQALVKEYNKAVGSGTVTPYSSR